MYDNDIYKILKKVSVDAVSSTKPCTWCYGNVKSVNPLKVSLNEKLEIDDDFIEFGSRRKENLEIDDKLILLQKAGGQLFLCLDVIRREE